MKVEVIWDSDVQVWMVIDFEVFGFVVEVVIFEDLCSWLQGLVFEFLVVNGYIVVVVILIELFVR